MIEEAIAAGPAGVRSAQKIALRHAKQMHEESVDYWRKITEFLEAWTDSSDSFYRARARSMRLYGVRDFWRLLR